MSIDINQVISDLESTGVKIATQQVMDYLVANVWSGFALSFVNPIVGWLVGFIVSILMVRLDWLAYMLVSDWQTSQEGADYITASVALANLPANADAATRAQYEQAKIDAFKKLVGLGSPTSL